MKECASVKLAVCAYHKPQAFCEITKMLQKLFYLSHTKGYMYFDPIIKNRLQYLRRGIIRAVKK